MAASCYTCIYFPHPTDIPLAIIHSIIRLFCCTYKNRMNVTFFYKANKTIAGFCCRTNKDVFFVVCDSESNIFLLWINCRAKESFFPFFIEGIGVYFTISVRFTDFSITM